VSHLDEATRKLERAVLADQSDEAAREAFHHAVARHGWGQCDECGGSLYGPGEGEPCTVCTGLGALPAGHAWIRRCAFKECAQPLAPAHVAVYCSDLCARYDT
jgi:hypothetical protein